MQSDNADARRGLECVVRWRVIKTYASVLLSGRTLRNATFHCYRIVRRCPPAYARRDRASVPALFASLLQVPVRGRYLARMSYRGIVVGRHATSSMSREGLGCVVTKRSRYVYSFCQVVHIQRHYHTRRNPSGANDRAPPVRHQDTGSLRRILEPGISSARGDCVAFLRLFLVEVGMSCTCPATTAHTRTHACAKALAHTHVRREKHTRERTHARIHTRTRTR